MEINKITYKHATVTVHIYTVTVAIVYKCIIMHNYAQVGVAVFLLKLCKSS